MSSGTRTLMWVKVLKKKHPWPNFVSSRRRSRKVLMLSPDNNLDRYNCESTVRPFSHKFGVIFQRKLMSLLLTFRQDQSRSYIYSLIQALNTRDPHTKLCSSNSLNSQVITLTIKRQTDAPKSKNQYVLCFPPKGRANWYVYAACTSSDYKKLIMQNFRKLPQRVAEI